MKSRPANWNHHWIIWYTNVTLHAPHNDLQWTHPQTNTHTRTHIVLSTSVVLHYTLSWTWAIQKQNSVPMFKSTRTLCKKMDQRHSFTELMNGGIRKHKHHRHQPRLLVVRVALKMLHSRLMWSLRERQKHKVSMSNECFVASNRLIREHLRCDVVFLGILVPYRSYRWCGYAFLEWYSWYHWYKVTLRYNFLEIALQQQKAPAYS